MFESAELGHTIDKKTYEKEVPELRTALLAAQYDLKERRSLAVIIVIGGVDGAGKGTTVNLIKEWMDPRYIRTHALGAPSDEERERPAMYRYWRVLPPKGEIGVFFGSWYSEPISDHARDKLRDADLDQRMDDIVRFENMLVNECALILKFWLHLSKKAQRKRFKSLESDRLTRWRVTALDWDHHRRYDKYRNSSERALRRTSTGVAPWTVVEGVDERYRNLTIMTAIQRAIRRRLDEPEKARVRAPVSPLPPRSGDVNVLRRLDQGQKIGNRELSLLRFNRRVLAEALDERLPVLERVRFLSIFDSNLDEFFMIRVSGLRTQMAAAASDRSADGWTAAEQLAAIRRDLLPTGNYSPVTSRVYSDIGILTWQRRRRAGRSRSIQGVDGILGQDRLQGTRRRADGDAGSHARANRPGDRAPPRARRWPDRLQMRRALGRAHHRRPLPCVEHRCENRPPGTGHLLSAPPGARPERERHGDLGRRAVSRAQEESTASRTAGMKSS